jgi:uncharacterized protein (TIGR03118 family)
MLTIIQRISNRFLKHTWLLVPAILVIIASCQKSITNQNSDEIAAVAKSPQTLKDFNQVNLIANNDKYGAARVDPALINGWGISFASNANGTTWISSEGPGLSLVVNNSGGQAIAPVSIPSPTASTGGHPSGQVFNGGAGFRLPNGNPARFIFAGLDGIISGWNGGTAAIKKIDDSPDAVYTGIALAADGADRFLYAANFSEGKIDVYDTAWAEVNNKPFMDPDLPAGYSPFNIQTVGTMLYVMYAKVDPVEHEEEVGPGNGYVDIFNTNGTLVKRFVSRGQLNAPWGVAAAPAGFWGEGNSEIQNVILIGNFGDGRINAFNENGKFLGQLRSKGNPIVIEGLWAITFPPPTATATDPGRLYFAAGPADEEDGLFGYIDK